MSKKTQQFHLGDVLSVTTGRLLSPRGIDGIYDILNFMTGDDLFTHQLPRASNECTPYLVKQFPALGSLEIALASDDLTAMLKTSSGRAHSIELILGWLSKIATGGYGQLDLPLCGENGLMLEVAKVPTEAHEQIDPVSELEQMVGPNKVVVVQT